MKVFRRKRILKTKIKVKKIIIISILLLILIVLLAGNVLLIKTDNKEIETKKEKMKENFIENIENDGNLEFSYKIMRKIGNKLKLLICLQHNEIGINKIEFPNKDILITNGTKEKIAKDYDIQIGDIYKINITLENGEIKEKVINIENFHVEKMYLLENGKDNTDITGGWEGIPYYGRETGTLTFSDVSGKDVDYANFIGKNEYTIYRKVTKNNIDWHKYETIKMRVKAYNQLSGYYPHGGISIELTNSKANYNEYYMDKLSAYDLVRYPTINEEIILSAKLPEDYINNTYISMRIHRCYAYVYDIWLE